MPKPSKASLVKDLKKANIDVPASAKIADMEHRLKHWKGGDGFLVRLLRKPNARHQNNPVVLLEDKTKMYWLPNSEMASEMIKSKIVLIMDRTTKPSKDAIVVDVQSDYDSRWQHGSNDITN